jgi:hypothetical protein
VWYWAKFRAQADVLPNTSSARYHCRTVIAGCSATADRRRALGSSLRMMMSDVRADYRR